MMGIQRNLLMILGIGAATVVAGGTPAGDANEETEVHREGKVKIVVVDEDGERQEEVYEFDSDRPRAFLGVVLDRAPGGGALVREVTGGSAAERAGLQPGDVIVGLDGEEIERPVELNMRILAAGPGERVELAVTRDGERRTITAELGERKHHGGHFLHLGDLEEHLKHLEDLDLDLDLDLHLPHPEHFAHPARPVLGVQLVEPTPELREHLGGRAEAGVLVGKVMAGMPAEQAGVLVGDLIVAVDGQPIEDAGDLIRALHGKRGETIELELIRDGRSVSIGVLLPEPDDEDETAGPRA